MRTRAPAIFFLSAALLSSANARATLTQGDCDNLAPVTRAQARIIQLAGSFHNSTAKLGDKSLSGQAGGFYGIGGSEPHVKYFKKKKPPQCCASKSR